MQDWEPNIEDLRKKISDKTQAILICSPNNPTGVLYGEKKIKEIIDLAGENIIYLFYLMRFTTKLLMINRMYVLRR